MSTSISTNYRALTPDELQRVTEDLANAWQDPEIPRRQYELAVKPELDKWRHGGACAPFDALVRCLKRLPLNLLAQRPRLLDIGASSGYYREVMEIAGFTFDYMAADFSPAFKALALELYPDMDFVVTDATDLPFHDGYYPVVLSGANIMHVPNYRLAIKEEVRVSSDYLLLHRTPILKIGPTKAFAKEAYGVPCLEWHFNESDLFAILQAEDLTLVYETDVFFDQPEGFGHRSYLLRKRPGLSHVSV